MKRPFKLLLITSFLWLSACTNSPSVSLPINSSSEPSATTPSTSETSDSPSISDSQSDTSLPPSTIEPSAPSVDNSVPPGSVNNPSVSTGGNTSSSVGGSSSSVPDNDNNNDDVYNDGWTYENSDNYYDYDSLSSGTGADLKTKLFNQITKHKTISYNGLNEAYRTTDLREDGTVWDMYGDFTFSLTGNACGNYKNEGDCWNKEHSMPKSWFNDASPMYSDIYHLFPTDGKINGMRGNYPFGEVGIATYTYVSNNASKTGLTITNKLGSSSYPGYTEKVFEPDDIYKGDFARAYFYMVTAYEDRVSNWDSSNTNLGGTKYPGLNGWSTELLLKWSIEDPVSQKEIDRTNAAYLLQENRNPYIDNNSLACRVFGTYNDTTKELCKSVLEGIPVTGVNIQESSVEVNTNQMYQFNATIVPSNATNKNVQWTSSDTNIGTINSNGLFTPKNAGVTTITVKTEDGDFTDTCQVTVMYAPPVNVTGVRLSESRLELIENQKATLVVTIEPEDATNKNYAFSSSNPSVADVSQNGVVTAKSEGNATITVTTEDGNFHASCEVIVNKSTLVSTVIDLEILSNSTVDGFEYVLGGTVKSQGDAVFIGNGGFIYNKTAFNNISKIEITYGSQGSASARQAYSFANSVLNQKPEEIDVLLETSTGGKTATIIPSTQGNQYFRLDVSNKNLQFTKLVIYF